MVMVVVFLACREKQLTEEMACPKAASDLMRVYEELKRSRRKASFTYLDLCMLYHFFFCLANRLMVAVAFQVHEISPKVTQLWNYPNFFLRDVIVSSSTTSTGGDEPIPTDNSIPGVPRSGGGDIMPSLPLSGGDLSSEEWG